MAICDWCNQEMTDENTKSCDGNSRIDFGDLVMKPLTYDGYLGERCPDCNVSIGGTHHPGCEMEYCPNCGSQMLTCRCLDK